MRIGYFLFVLPIYFLAKLFLSTIINGNVNAVSWSPNNNNERSHSLTKLSDQKLETIALLQENNSDDFNSSLKEICIPRVVGTEGNRAVREYIVKSMEDLEWSVEENSFNANTPFGQKPFTNIIATLDPSACRRLVLACHHDTLPNRESTFLGATDSAVPCSMMLNMAKMLDPYLKKQKEKSDQITLQYLFFDGEEALKKWSSTDSLYGSRHLAAKWNSEKVQQLKHCAGDYPSQLDRIDVLMLLDLIGCSNPKFYNYFPDTLQLFGQLIDIEKRMNRMNKLEREDGNPTKYFVSRTIFHFVEDDHTPFMQKGVPVLHLIPTPFPQVWHKESDDLEHLDHPTISNLLKIFSSFISEYLHLPIPETSR